MESIYLSKENAKLMKQAVENVSSKYGYTDSGVHFCEEGANNTEIKFDDGLYVKYLFKLFNEYAELRLKPQLVTLGELAEQGRIK